MPRSVIFYFAQWVLIPLAAFALNMIASPVAAAENFPSKTISWLVPYAPGGGFDLHSRAVVRGLKNRLGVSVIIKNVPGAGGNIGWNLLWKAKPLPTVGDQWMPILNNLFALMEKYSKVFEEAMP